ncbi:MAG: Na/Pi cotransporter family protein [Tateyamaria sp.]|nr:Na/Pi cotransporter family protein [Tateyamaria sp.]MBT6342557.1 Na/Pi cotransporter family protein [Tateyamaria sp.]
MVQTGVEQAYGPSFRRVMMRSRAKLNATFCGALLAVIMQSSMAVTILVSGLLGSSVLSFELGLAATLGADLGSALVIQFLSLDIRWLAPLMLVVGGLMLLKSETPLFRQIGRVIMGVALILLALSLIRTNVSPLSNSSFLPNFALILERDFLTAFLMGALLAFLLHSSVAAVLMFVALVASEALPLMVGVSLVLGANFGSSLLPIWMTRTMSPKARQLPLMNLFIRGGAAFGMVVMVNRIPLFGLLSEIHVGQQIILTHIIFNAMLLVVIPFSELIGRCAAQLLPEHHAPNEDVPAHYRSVLDKNTLGTPALALACIQREIHRMLLLTQDMMLPIMTLFDRYDKQQNKKIIENNKRLNDAFDGIRHYSGELSQHITSNSHRRQLRHLLEFAIAIEAAGNIVAKTLSPLALTRAKEDLRFSTKGLSELEGMHDRIIANISLASNVLVSRDVDIARQLVEEKSELSRRQRKSRKSHLKRLATGLTESLETSDLHLETSLAFKEFNSQIATIAYPILSRKGKLLNSRLVDED